MKTIIFLQYAKFWKYYSVLGEIQLEFLWHTAFRASEDYVRGVSHGMVHGGSAPSDAHDCRSEDCEGQLASQPTHEGTVWHVALQRQQVGQAFVDGLSFKLPIPPKVESISTLTAGMQSWIHVKVKLFTRPLLPLHFLTPPTRRV